MLDEHGLGLLHALAVLHSMRTRRWATMQSIADDTRNGSMPMSIEAPECAGRVVRVQRREHEVAGQRRLDRDVRASRGRGSRRP